MFIFFSVSYMPGMLYPYGAPSGAAAATLYPTSSIIYPTLPVLPVPVVPPLASTINAPQPPLATLQQNNVNVISNYVQTENKQSVPLSQFQRPASQATSVKAEPGSGMGSIASASVVNKVINVTVEYKIIPTKILSYGILNLKSCLVNVLLHFVKL